MGDFDVELYWKHAPNTCRNFAELARRGYYNGTKFHRIIKDFIIQGNANYLQEVVLAQSNTLKRESDKGKISLSWKRLV